MSRRLLVALAGIAAIALAAAFVWLPLERTRFRLAHELPALRASLAAMERQAEEARRLRAMPAAPATLAPAPLASLVASGELGRGLVGVQVAAIDARHVRVTGSDIAFGTLLEWLARAQSAHGLQVESARIEALPAAGRVRAELDLARS